MAKTLLFLSFIGLLFMAVGTQFAPNYLVFWFGSTSLVYEYIRVALMTVLGLQLLTKPPRHIVFRMIASIVGLGGIMWVCNETYLFQMQLLDALSIMSASLAIVVTAIERKAEVLRVITKPKSRSPRLQAN